VLEAGILEKLIDAVTEMAEKDEDNVSVITVLIITMTLRKIIMC